MRATSSPTGIPGYSAASNLRVAHLAALSAALLAASPASAQSLPHLTVTALSITSERLSVPEGQAFHLTIHVHATQRGANFASLILPSVTNLTILGDEKRSAPQRGEGTDYLEVLTVAGIKPGEATVSSAYIDADDPSRGDRPFRFSSNTLRLRITSSSPQTAPSWQAAASNALRTAGFVALGIVVFATLGFAIVRIARARGKREYVTLAPARPVVPRPTVTVDRNAEVREAALSLTRERTRERAARLRAALFAAAGARSDETLTVLLERLPPERRELRAALRAAERATFVDGPNLQGAIDDLLDAVRQVSAV